MSKKLPSLFLSAWALVSMTSTRALGEHIISNVRPENYEVVFMAMTVLNVRTEQSVRGSLIVTTCDGQVVWNTAVFIFPGPPGRRFYFQIGPVRQEVLPPQPLIWDLTVGDDEFHVMTASDGRSPGCPEDCLAAPRTMPIHADVIRGVSIDAGSVTNPAMASYGIIENYRAENYEYWWYISVALEIIPADAVQAHFYVSECDGTAIGDGPVNFPAGAPGRTTTRDLFEFLEPGLQRTLVWRVTSQEDDYTFTMDEDGRSAGSCP